MLVGYDAGRDVEPQIMFLYKMRLVHDQEVSLNSRSSHLPNFNHLVIKAFAKHLVGRNDVSEANKQYFTNLEYIGYSGVTQ